jgi:hypothetical protein
MTTIEFEGYTAQQAGVPRSSNPHIGAYAAQWCRGWDMANVSKFKYALPGN